MYAPEIYRKSSRAENISIMREYPLATVTALCGQRIQSAHIPIIVDETKDGSLTLTGHLAKDNDLVPYLEQQELLVHFHGPQAYLTPYWYSQLNHFPTWIYAAVHVYGRARILDDIMLSKHLQSLIEQQERVVMPEGNWNIEIMPSNLTQHLIQMIVGFQLKVEEIQSCFRLNQAKPKADIEALAASLASSNCRQERALSDLVLRHAGRVAEEDIERHRDKYRPRQTSQ